MDSQALHPQDFVDFVVSSRVFRQDSKGLPGVEALLQNFPDCLVAHNHLGLLHVCPLSWKPFLSFVQVLRLWLVDLTGTCNFFFSCHLYTMSPVFTLE